MTIVRLSGIVASAAAALLMFGCTQAIILKKTPSELVLTSIKSDTRNISYAFESKVEDPFKFDSFTFDINATYVANFRAYMNTKYSSVGEGSDLKIDITLESCVLKVENANSGAQNAANVFGAMAGQRQQYSNVLMTTEVTMKVKVDNGGNVTEKNIFSSDEYNGSRNDVESARKCFDQAIGKSIIMVDKFLNTIE